VVPALEELGRSYALAVITNGPADVQRMKLRVTGLDRFFAAVIISSEIGLAKPHQRASLRRSKHSRWARRRSSWSAITLSVMWSVRKTPESGSIGRALAHRPASTRPTG
jgi:hypothetical protein